MNSLYEQFKEGTLKEGQRFSVTGTIVLIDAEDPALPLKVDIDGEGIKWLKEGAIKYMEPAAEKLYEVSIGGRLLSYYGSDYEEGKWTCFLWRSREEPKDIFVQAFPMSFLEKHFPEVVDIAKESNKEEGGNAL